MTNEWLQGAELLAGIDPARISQMDHFQTVNAMHYNDNS